MGCLVAACVEDRVSQTVFSLEDCAKHRRQGDYQVFPIIIVKRSIQEKLQSLGQSPTVEITVAARDAMERPNPTGARIGLNKSLQLEKHDAAQKQQIT